MKNSIKKTAVKSFLLLCLITPLLTACSNPRTVSVSGAGTVTFLPDTVNFSVTVRNLEPSMSAASSATALTVKEILAVCKQFGINDGDLKTSYVNTGKKYDRSDYKSPEVFAGYTAEQTIKINYRDLPQFERFSEALLALDITALNDVQFSHSRMTEFASEADLKALDNAREAAVKMAERMNVKLGRLVYMASTPDAPPFRNAYVNGPLFARASADTAGVEVSPGILSVTGNVQVVFEIK